MVAQNNEDEARRDEEGACVLHCVRLSECAVRSGEQSYLKKSRHNATIAMRMATTKTKNPGSEYYKRTQIE